MSEESKSNKAIKLLIFDRDPIFQIGLRTALQAYTNLTIIAQAETIEAILNELQEDLADLVIIDLDIDLLNSNNNTGLKLCQILQEDYPELPILLCCNNMDSQLLLAARDYGARGYCPKGSSIITIVEAIERVAGGQDYWQTNTLLASQKRSKSKWFSRLRQSGMRQIEGDLTAVEQRLDSGKMALFDWLYWRGRKRELMAARWLVDRLLPVEVIVIESSRNNSIIGTNLRNDNNDRNAISFSNARQLPINLHPQRSIPLTIVDNTVAKIQAGVFNPTGITLEIDVLQTEKKQELLYLVLNQLERVLEELQLLQFTAENLPDRLSLILRDIWQSSSIYFLSKHYTSQLEVSDNTIVDLLSQEAAVVKEYIINKIPFVLELFDYLLFDTPLVIDSVTYRVEALESLNRAEILLQNAIVQIANAVMQVILNNFYETEIVKANLYQQQYRSSRELARFRNDLSWRYRQEKYFEEPKQIFESQYRILFLNGRYLERTYIYAPRTEELNKLTGIPWFVTIALEMRDATSPRLRSAVNAIGRVIIYLLTKVLGRAIGLIGKGIVQGLGNTWQEAKTIERSYGKKERVIRRESDRNL
jgi:DNA-binding NarL/FixJ family response regulator